MPREKSEKKFLIQNIRLGWSPFIVLALTTLATIAISLYCLSRGWFIIFQNLLYVPIVIACSCFTKKGFIFSFILSFIYFSLIIIFTGDLIVITQALVRVVIFIGIAGVITFLSIGRKRVEEALRERDDIYRDIFMFSSDAIMTLEPPDWKFISANPATLEMFKVKSVAEFLSYEPWKLSPELQPDGRASDEKAKEMIETAMREGSNFFEWVHKRVSGEYFFANVSLSRVEHSGKMFIHAVVRDATERKKVEAEREIALKRQQDVNALQQSLLAPATLESKLKAITDNIVRIFNADFCRIWLIRPGDLCDKGCIHAEVKEGPHVCRFRDKCLHLMSSSGRYTHIDGKGHARVPFGCYKIGLVASGKDHKFLTNDAANDPRVHNHEWVRELGLASFAGYQLKVPGGETIGVMALFAKHIIMPDEDAALDNFSIAASFVTQQAVAEEKLANAYAGLEDKIRERTKELREAQEKIIHSEKMAVVGQLASSVAHELRNPLGVMKNAIYYLNMLGVGKDSSDVKENMEIISKEIDNSDKVISDLLEFSRIKQPALRLENINLIIKEALSRVKSPAGIEVVAGLGKDMPQIQVDALQMQQVFYNLAQNAIQAMEKGGALTVSSCVARNDNIAIVFKDTGCGIPEENLQKIFDPLFSTKAKGTGLGLSVVASLVEGHGGKLEVESEVGKGTIFTVKLPIKKE